MRIIHHPSGARGEACDSRDQLSNKRNAFQRMAESQMFQNWVRARAAELRTGKTLDQIVDADMHSSNLKVEVRTESGWEVLDE